MRRPMKIALTVAAALALLVLGQMAGRYSELSLPRDNVAERSALLSPYYRISLPDGGAGPFPTALLASGCDGPRDNMERWAALLNAEGWATVIVDSHGPRGYDDYQIWRLICAGQLLTGTERAADLLVAMQDVRTMATTDPDRILLLGASHGGWAILDLLALQDRRRRPPGLRSWPGGSKDAAFRGLQAGITLYPYCGPGSLAARRGWRRHLPLLMVLVEGDTITDDADCQELAARQTAQGLSFPVHMMTGVTHGFDQKERALFSPLEFDQKATDATARLINDFLKSVQTGELR